MYIGGDVQPVFDVDGALYHIPAPGNVGAVQGQVVLGVKHRVIPAHHAVAAQIDVIAALLEGHADGDVLRGHFEGPLFIVIAHGDVGFVAVFQLGIFGPGCIARHHDLPDVVIAVSIIDRHAQVDLLVLHGGTGGRKPVAAHHRFHRALRGLRAGQRDRVLCDLHLGADVQRAGHALGHGEQIGDDLAVRRGILVVRGQGLRRAVDLIGGGQIFQLAVLEGDDHLELVAGLGAVDDLALHVLGLDGVGLAVRVQLVNPDVDAVLQAVFGGDMGIGHPAALQPFVVREQMRAGRAFARRHGDVVREHHVALGLRAAHALTVAGGGMFAAADGRDAIGVPAGLRAGHSRDVAGAADVQHAAVSVLAAADARGADAALGNHRAAPDGDIASVSGEIVVAVFVREVAAAANTRAAGAAGGVDRAVPDRHRGALAAAQAAADARALSAALGGQLAAVDGDLAAAAALAAAEARGVDFALGVHFAAIEREVAAGFLPVAADAGLAVGLAGGGQLARPAPALPVDGQAVPYAQANALRGGQRRALPEDQVDVALDDQAVVQRDIAADDVPLGAALLQGRGVGPDGGGCYLRGLSKRPIVGRHRAVVGDGDLIFHAVDGYLQPLLGDEGLVDRKRPLPRLVGGGEQCRVADGGALDLAHEAHRGQHRRQGHAFAAVQHVLQGVVGEFYGVDREAVGLGRDGLLRRVHVHVVQLVRRQIAVLVLRDVVYAGLQVLVRRLLQREGDLRPEALGGLDLVAVGVQYLDVKGVGDGHVLIVLARLLHGGFGFEALHDGHARHGEPRALRERARLGLYGDDHAVYAPGLFKGHRLGNRLQHDGEVQRFIRFRHREGDVFEGDVALRRGGIGVLAGKQRVAAVCQGGDGGVGRRIFARLRGLYVAVAGNARRSGGGFIVRGDGLRQGVDRQHRVRRIKREHHGDGSGGESGGSILDISGVLKGFPFRGSWLGVSRD